MLKFTLTIRIKINKNWKKRKEENMKGKKYENSKTHSVIKNGCM